MNKEEILDKYLCLLKSSKEIYIYGAKICGEHVLKYLTNKNIVVKAFIDDDEYFYGKNINGIKIYPSNMIDNHDISIVVASDIFMYEISLKLKKMGFKNIVPFFVLTLDGFNTFDICKYYNTLFDDYIENRDKYNNLFSLFTDELSVETLKILINFRKTYDWTLFSHVSQNQNNKYFDFFSLDNDIFVDGGCFDGATTKQFITLNGKYKKIYAFEPDKISFNNAKKNLQNFHNIDIYNKGLSDKQEVLLFKSLADHTSCFTEKGNFNVETVCLDNVVKEEKAFVKLDIEGFEYKAICGAKKLLENSSQLAIALYHNSQDLWKIPELILSINKNYKFFLRHYSNNIFDTVLYAV